VRQEAPASPKNLGRSQVREPKARPPRTAAIIIATANEGPYAAEGARRGRTLLRGRTAKAELLKPRSYRVP